MSGHKPLNPRLQLAIARRRRIAEQKRADSAPKHPNDPSAIPDAWLPKYQPEPPPEPMPTPTPAPIERPARRPLARPAVPAQPPAEKKPVPEPTQRERKLDKKRSKKITIAMSEEEESLLRRFLRERELSLSSWGRDVLFAAMQIPIPSRH